MERKTNVKKVKSGASPIEKASVMQASASQPLKDISPTASLEPSKSWKRLRATSFSSFLIPFSLRDQHYEPSLSV
jgi:hypothetical protein